MAATANSSAHSFSGRRLHRRSEKASSTSPRSTQPRLDLSISLLIAALVGAIAWNLITWFWGIPSSSSHALVGGMVGAVLVAYGPEKIIWKGLFYVVFVLFVSPVLGLIFGNLFFKLTVYLSRNATPNAKFFFNRMQILSSIALALSHGANDAQKSMGLITLSLVILGFSRPFTFLSGSSSHAPQPSPSGRPAADGELSKPWARRSTVCGLSMHSALKRPLPRLFSEQPCWADPFPPPMSSLPALWASAPGNGCRPSGGAWQRTSSSPGSLPSRHRQ